MNIHEYQAKDILRSYGVPVPRGRVALTADQVESVAREMGGRCVVKAQIYAGGRGKAGGVRLSRESGRGSSGGKRSFRKNSGNPPDRTGRADCPPYSGGGGG